MSDGVKILSYKRSDLEMDALTGLFRGLAARNVRYAVLRNHESLPQTVGARDIDIVVESGDLAKAVDAVRNLAIEMGLAYATHYHDDRLTQFTLVRRLSVCDLLDLKIDFFTSSQVYGITALSATQMLEDVWRHNGIPVVSDRVKLLDKWLFHLVVGQPLHPKYDADFATIAADPRARIGEILLPIFGAETAGRLMRELEAGRGSQIRPLSALERLAALWRLRRRQGIADIMRIVRFVGFRFCDRLHPAGIFISISGPDGSGKTTVIKLVIAQLRQLYGTDSVGYQHFRPSLLPRIASVAKASKTIKVVDENYADPHRARPSGPLGSLVRFGYYWLDYVGGYMRAIHPALVRREVVLFDRYIYDMIGDPSRSRIALPAGLMRIMLRITPLPRWAFFIRVPAEIVHARKQELTVDAIKVINARYSDLARRGMLVAIDNEGAPEIAAAAIVDRIVAARDARARQAIARFAR